jgi:predicted DNA-binding transcriptional regulator AlpA
MFEAEKKYLPGYKVQQRYNISDMTLWRWRKNRGFPDPMKVGERSFYDLELIEQWERRMVVAA